MLGQPLQSAEVVTFKWSFFASAAVSFCAGLCSILATFAWVGDVHQHVILWPVTGIILAITLPVAAGLWSNLFLYLAGAVGVLLGGWLCGMPLGLATLIGALTAMDLAVSGYFMSPHVKCFDDLKHRRNGMRLVFASLVGPLVTGMLGGVQVAAFLREPSSWLTAGMSSLADALGVAIFVPAVLFLGSGGLFSKRRKPRVKPLPAALSFAFFSIVCVGTFWQNTGPYLFLIFPPMMVLLLTLGLEGAVFSSILLTVVGSFATSHGHGPICLVRTSSTEVHLMTLQVFIWVSIVTALPVAAALDERRRAEVSATHSLSVQRTILQYTREAMVLSSLDGQDRYASAAIQQLTGWTPDEYVGLKRMETLHPDDRARGREMIERLRAGVREASLRYRILHKNGEWKWVEASLSAYGDDATAGYVGTIRDITEQIENEQIWMRERQVLSEEQRRLAEAETAANYQIRLRDEFLSHVSHELRSPLTSIYSFTSIIADGLAGSTSSEQDEYLAIVMKNVVQLQAMIEDLLTVTQSREGKLNIEPQRTSINEAISDVLNNLRHRADRKHIRLVWQRTSAPEYVFADPTRVRQVLIILLDNAIKFTGDGGVICVRVAPYYADDLMIKIIDNGCGIPREKWDLVFKKLYQVDNLDVSELSDTGRSGLGLGLHIAESLVLRQSGLIWVTSVPGQGSVFHFTLPLHKQGEPSSAAPAHSASANHSR